MVGLNKKKGGYRHVKDGDKMESKSDRKRKAVETDIYTCLAGGQGKQELKKLFDSSPEFSLPVEQHKSEEKTPFQILVRFLLARRISLSQRRRLHGSKKKEKEKTTGIKKEKKAKRKSKNIVAAQRAAMAGAPVKASSMPTAQGGCTS